MAVIWNLELAYGRFLALPEKAEAVDFIFSTKAAARRGGGGLRLGTSGHERGLNLGAEGGLKGHNLKLRREPICPRHFSNVSHSEDKTDRRGGTAELTSAQLSARKIRRQSTAVGAAPATTRP